jgi:hypothetical protein
MKRLPFGLNLFANNGRNRENNGGGLQDNSSIKDDRHPPDGYGDGDFGDSDGDGSGMDTSFSAYEGGGTPLHATMLLMHNAEVRR